MVACDSLVQHCRMQFEWWIAVMLLPLIPLGYTVVMDNAGIHRKRILRAMFAMAGVNLLFLPPYCPVAVTLSPVVFLTCN